MFTDSDVARLKRYSERAKETPKRLVELPSIEIDNLLIRLEAAEKCVELCSTDECCCCVPEFGPKGKAPDAISWHEIWKKFCGKE